MSRSQSFSISNHFVNRGSNHGEVKPVNRAHVAVQHLADVQSDINIGKRQACRFTSQIASLQVGRRLNGGVEGAAASSLLIRLIERYRRQHRIADKFEDMASARPLSEEDSLARERERLWDVACTRARELACRPGTTRPSGDPGRGSSTSRIRTCRSLICRAFRQQRASPKPVPQMVRRWRSSIAGCIQRRPQPGSPRRGAARSQFGAKKSIAQRRRAQFAAHQCEAHRAE